MVRDNTPVRRVRFVVDLPLPQARALWMACRRFQYGDAQHLLRHYRNLRPDALCEAMTSLERALSATLSRPE